MCSERRSQLSAREQRALTPASRAAQSGTNALFVGYAEDPSPLATISAPLYSLFIAKPPHVAQPSSGCRGPQHLPLAADDSV